MEVGNKPYWREYDCGDEKCTQTAVIFRTEVMAPHYCL